MEWSREYLQRHNIHRLMEDCVEDLVVEQPPTKEGIVKTIIQRLETIRRRFDFPQQKVVLVLADPLSTDFRAIIDMAANSCGASVLDGKGLRAEEIRDLLTTAAEKAFILNFPMTIGDAIAFEGCFGKPFKTVLFQNDSFLKSVPRTDERFSTYARGANAVAELYEAKQQLIKINESGIDEACAKAMSAFS